MIPPPVIEKHDGFLVLRDDLIPGGTKSRVIDQLLTGQRSPISSGFGLAQADKRKVTEYVYASPACGAAQLAIALGCKERGFKATIFVAERKEHHPRTLEAIDVGAVIRMIPNGRMRTVQARAREYAAETGAVVLPFGLDCPEMLKGLCEVAKSFKIKPKEVWTVVGSGTLTRALQLAWPKAEFNAVRVGCKTSKIGRAKEWICSLPFDRDATILPPFPSCSNYDSKCWEFLLKYASPGAFFWNVAG